MGAAETLRATARPLLLAALCCGFVASERQVDELAAPMAEPGGEEAVSVQGIVMEVTPTGARIFRNDISEEPLEILIPVDAATAFKRVDSLAAIKPGSELRARLACDPAVSAGPCRAIELTQLHTREETARNLRSAKLYNLTRHLAVTNLPDDIAREAGIASLNYEKRAADDKARPVAGPVGEPRST